MMTIGIDHAIWGDVTAPLGPESKGVRGMLCCLYPPHDVSSEVISSTKRRLYEGEGAASVVTMPRAPAPVAVVLNKRREIVPLSGRASMRKVVFDLVEEVQGDRARVAEVVERCLAGAGL